MKPLKDMNQTELIELVAAVSLRVIGFTYTITALRGAIAGLLMSYSISQIPVTAHSTYTGHLALYASIGEQIVVDTGIALVCFLIKVPLARLITYGLTQVLASKPTEY